VRTHFHADGLGSIVKHSNASGVATTTLRHSAYGALEAGTPSPFGYTGREWDVEANLYFYRERYLDVSTGRFISEDPTGFDGGINLYTYVLDNPVNFRDPMGLWAFPPPKYPVPMGICATQIFLKHVSQKHNGRYWHCYASCEIVKTCGMGGRVEAAVAGHLKEVGDVIRCLATNMGCKSAAQRDDYDDNRKGRNCPDAVTCDKECTGLQGQGIPGPLSNVPNWNRGGPPDSDLPPLRGQW
jgi:RHS repeat-associated protein